MPLIMGILAQSAAAPGPTPGAGAYDLLETEILTGSQASVTFSSLNSTYGSTYQHLQIRLTGRNSTASTGTEELRMQLNSDTGSNYASHRLLSNGSTVSSAGYASQSELRAGWIFRNNATANAYGAVVIDILDPFETKYTTLRIFSGEDVEVALLSGLWMNTAALTDIELYPEINSFVTGSRFSLYGLKGA